jgi:PmbA protein
VDSGGRQGRRCYNSAMSGALDTARMEELHQVVRDALGAARAAGASQAEVDASVQQGLNVTVRLGEVETLEYHRDRGVAVTVYFGHRKGSASTADLRPEAITTTVAKACAIARHTASDDCAGLAEPDDMAREVPDLDLDHPWGIEPDAAVVIARECEAAGRAVDARIANSEGATLSTQRGLRVYGNSHGFLAGLPGTSHSLSCSLIAQAGSDMQRDYWYSVSRNATQLLPAAEIGRRAARRAIARLGARRIATQRAPVLFAPELARGFYGHFIGAIRGASQYRRASFLLDAAGERLFPAAVQMRERPHLRGALASAPFDGEGVATRERTLVNDGVLDGYVLGSYSARKLGLRTTGNAGGIHNLDVHAPAITLDFEGLLRRMGTGLYVTELMGMGVNGVTGDYSRGASGYWVENGALAYPVHELTIAGNLRAMMQDVQAVGSDVDTQGAIRCGAVLLGEMTIAGE